MIDLTNLKLLFELNWNCRQTHSELAKNLKISKQVVSYRINQLENKKIIKGYHALIDWRKLGYNAIRIYLKWHNIDSQTEKQIYAEIKRDPFFMWAVKIEGEVDLGFYVWVKEFTTFSEKWFSFLTKYRKYILKQEICESVHMTHYPMKPLVNKPNVLEKTVGENKPEEYDLTDYEILKAVTQNGRISLIELSKKINLTSKAALYRLKKLQKKEIILGYNALIDTNKLGYRFYKIDFYLNDLSRIKEMFEFSKQHKNVIYRMRTIGGPDFEIEIMVKSVSEMKQIINEIKDRFSLSVNHTRIHIFEYTIKQVYLPGESIII